MKYSFAVFDLDGTLLNTLEDLNLALNFALKNNGFPLRSIDETRVFVGNGIRNLVKRALPAGASEETIDVTLADFFEFYRSHIADKTLPYDGIPELLAELKRNGYKLAVASNKADASSKILINKFFGEIFDEVIGERDGLRKKPSPDMIDFLLSRHNFPKTDVVYVGDSEVDFMTAKNAGLSFIGVAWGFRDRVLLASMGAKIAENVNELKNFLI